MIDKYIIEDDIVKIYISRKRGCYQGQYECLVDKDDFEKIKGFPLNIVYRKEVKGNFYLVFTEYLGTIDGKPKYKLHYIHRDLIQANKGDYVDHINHNPLDNRKCNLRITTDEENTRNRTNKNKNNTSGYRNVSKVGKWYYVQIQINGENTLLKKFPLSKLNEAGIYAKEMRQKYYKEFAGES